MSLKKQLGRSTAWMTVAAGVNSISSFFIFIFLSRILEPKDIGLVAFALIIVEIGKIIVNAGFPQAIVQNPIWDNVYASTCFHLNMIFATALTLIVFIAGAPLVARFYDPQAVPILQVLSSIFFIEGIKAVHEGKLKREFAFKVIAMRTIFGGIISGAVGIFLAIENCGVWALVWQQIINHAIVTIFTIASAKWKPAFVFSRADYQQLMRFSSPLMVAQLIGNVASKIFEVLIGLFFGPAALGFYRVGGRALYILQDIVLKPFENTLLSALSRMEDLTTKANATLRVIRISGFVTFPIFFGAAAVGSEFIIFAFGEKWSSSGEIMTILALGIVPLVIGTQVNSAITASGHSKYVMTLAAIVFALNCAIGIAAIPFGLIVAAYAFSIRCYISIYFNMIYFRKVFGVTIFKTLSCVAAPFSASFIMFCIIYGLKNFLPSNLPILLKLIGLCLSGGLIYCCLMLIVFRRDSKIFLAEIVGMDNAKLKPIMLKIQRYCGFK